MLAAAIFGSSVVPQGHCCWQAPVWSPPPSLLAPGAYPPTSGPAPASGPPIPAASPLETWPCQPMGHPVGQPWDTPGRTASHAGTSPACPPVGWQPLHGAGPGNQVGQGPALPTSAPTVVSPATTEGPIQLTEGTL